MADLLSAAINREAFKKLSPAGRVMLAVVSAQFSIDDSEIELSLSDLEAQSGLSAPAVKKAVAELEKKRCISMERRIVISPGDFKAPEKKEIAAGGEFVCDVCGKTFKNAAGLGSHASRMHG